MLLKHQPIRQFTVLCSKISTKKLKKKLLKDIKRYYYPFYSLLIIQRSAMIREVNTFLLNQKF